MENRAIEDKHSFEELIRHILYLIKEFYMNYDTWQLYFEVQIRGQVMNLEAHHLNAILRTLKTDPQQLK